MKKLQYLFVAVCSVVVCRIPSCAATLGDSLHFVDEYPACSFTVVDSKSNTPINGAYAKAEWYKNVGIVEYATTPCNKDFRSHIEGSEFSIPAVSCTGFRFGTTLEVRIKVLGYEVKKFRIQRRPRKSDIIPYISYLPIKDCGTFSQKLPLVKIESEKDALAQYRDDYNRNQISSVFVDTEAYHQHVISELMSLDPSIDIAAAKKVYCDAVHSVIPTNSDRAQAIKWMEPYCRDYP